MDSKSKAKSRDDAVRDGDKGMLHVHLFQDEQKESPTATATATAPGGGEPGGGEPGGGEPGGGGEPAATLPPLSKHHHDGMFKPAYSLKPILNFLLSFQTNMLPHYPRSVIVMYGRGIVNPYFNNLVRAVIMEYVATPKHLKSFFATEVLNQIRSLNPPGRFLDRDKQTGVYYEVSNEKALYKTRQSFRDMKQKIKKGKINVKDVRQGPALTIPPRSLSVSRVVS